MDVKTVRKNGSKKRNIVTTPYGRKNGSKTDTDDGHGRVVTMIRF